MTSTSSKLKYKEDNNAKRRWAQDILFRLHEEPTALAKCPLYFVVTIATVN